MEERVKIIKLVTVLLKREISKCMYNYIIKFYERQLIQTSAVETLNSHTPLGTYMTEIHLKKSDSILNLAMSFVLSCSICVCCQGEG